MSSRSKRVFDWLDRHKWKWRIPYAVAMLFLVAVNIRTCSQVGWSFWTVVSMGCSVSVLAMTFWLWWRADQLDEFAERTRAAIGPRANLLILSVRQSLRTRSVWKLNQTMRRYDVMGTPRLDLPQEAKELRDILDELQKAS